MEKIVILHKDISDYLENLIEILFEKEYFGFEESAQDYVSNLYDFIEFELINFSPKPTPKKIIHFGSKYVFYKANERTTWYIFFENKDHRYLITYITNNHTEDIRLF